MGVYCYTLRAGTKVVSGVEIGRTAYSYKCHWGDHSSPVVRRKHAAAERAREANPNLTLVIMGDYKDAECHEGIAVFQVSDRMEFFLDTNSPGPVVGKLYKVRGRYVYESLQGDQ